MARKNGLFSPFFLSSRLKNTESCCESLRMTVHLDSFKRQSNSSTRAEESSAKKI
jgi:hypothetical protein